MWTAKFWRPGSTLTVKFMSGSDWQKSKVQEIASVWTSYANINFQFVDSGGCNILINFAPDDGSWSLVGTDSQYYASQGRASMNLSPVNQSSSDAVILNAILHEFGHALGAVHEHESPNANIDWNKPVVYAELEGPPNNWSKATVYANMFTKYSSTIVQATRFDLNSIMIYYYPASWTLNGKGAPFNSELSSLDKQFIQSCYPGRAINPDSMKSPMTVTCVSRIPGSYDVFGLGTNKDAQHKALTGTVWQPANERWESLGNVFVHPLSVTAGGVQRLDVFGTGINAQVWHNLWNGQSWMKDWEQLGGEINSPIAAVRRGSSRLDIFALTSNNSMCHKWCNDSAWSPTWEGLGGLFNSPPAVVSRGLNLLDVFALGTDNQMYRKYWDGNKWNPSKMGWESLGGTLNSAPSVTSWGPNRLDVFALGTDNQILHKSWNGSVWEPSSTDWTALGGRFNTPPAVTSWGPGRIDIFAMNTLNQMLHKSWNSGSGWSPSGTDWENLGGVFNSGPAVTSWGQHRLDVFALGTDNQMYHKWWWNTQWMPSTESWEALGGNLIPMI